MTGIIETLEFPIHSLDVFRRTQLVVQFFADEGQHHASESRAQKPSAEVQPQRGLRGVSGTRAGSTMRMLADFEAAAMPASLIFAYSELYSSTSV